MSGDALPPAQIVTGASGSARVLVAGVGNVLRGDDGFGPAVLTALEAAGGLPPGTRTVEVGIAGVRLVQELMDGYDVLVIIDAVDRGGEPGELFVLEPDTPDPASLPPDERRLLAGDMHQLVPARVLALAAALNVLPRHVRIIGCQPVTTEECVLELSAAVAAVIPAAVHRVGEIIAELTGTEPGTAAAEAALCGDAAVMTPTFPADSGGEVIRRRDELLQVMYWLRGEGFAADAAPADIARFLDAADVPPLAKDLDGLIAAGLAERTDAGRFRLSPAGIAEGGRRFAEEFAGLQHQGHGACSDPECDCHTAGPEACLHQHR